ncbi:hypothetical protein GCM10022278_02450 [Allohahella marinimesophila]|uniref:PAS domain S-box-containing protein/diguanylate cyclase (GGDEF)-like protein n=1 Tax=Allohahella marinimesophila TaxID=1054972 RepID=A0ABP7NGY4_9GAMM
MLSKAEALDQLDTFKPYTRRTVNLGFSDAVHWLFIPQLLEFHTLKEQATYYLEVGYSLLDHVDAVVLTRPAGSEQPFDQAAHFHTGDREIFAQRPVPHPNFIFPIDVLPDTEYAVLLRIKTDSAVQVPLNLWTPAGFSENTFDQAVFSGGLIGIIAIMALTNLLLYLSVGDRSYLYFAMCMSGYAIVQACTLGLAFQYIWPASIFLQEKGLMLAANFTLASLALFTREFLGLESFAPRAASIFRLLAAANILICVLVLVLPYSAAIKITTLNVGVSPFLNYCIGVWLLIQGHKSARLYVSAFSVFIVSAVIFILSKFGLVDRSLFSEYSVHFGAITAVSLMSFALADRIRLERKLKEEAQDAAIRHLDSYRTIYEHSLEGLFQLDENGTLLVCNSAFLKLMGAHSKAELATLAPTMKNLVPESAVEFRLLYKRLKNHGQVIGYETSCRDLLGNQFWGTLNMHTVQLPGERMGYEGSLIDITDRRRHQDQLKYYAEHDALTGLINRLVFEKQVQGAIETAATGDHEHAMLFMDLDQFKIVNDTGGHSAGDELLRLLASEFSTIVKDTDTIARFGGDEFAILLNDCDLDEAKKVGDRLREAVADFKFAWQGKTFSIGVSIGIVAITQEIATLENLFSLADTACYAAKDAGRNRVVVHSDASHAVRIRQGEMILVGELRNAIKADQLRLFTQPIQALQRQRKGAAYELLVRFEAGDQTLLPGAFLPAAERFNVINLIDRWVIEHYFDFLKQNPRALETLSQANINLSAQTIGSQDFQQFLTAMFKRYEIPENKICFEITESAAVASLTDTKHFLMSMRRNGLKFALDDFGSGFSSYSYLKSLPVDLLKIDGSFVRDVFEDPVDLAMVKSITEIAHLTGMGVCAEYVESKAVLELMTHLGVDYAQGFYIGEPEVLFSGSGQQRPEQ